MEHETVTLAPICMECGTKKMLFVDADGYKRWKDGELIQRAMPQLTNDEREILISGICGKCFDAMFEDDQVRSEWPFGNKSEEVFKLG